MHRVRCRTSAIVQAGRHVVRGEGRGQGPISAPVAPRCAPWQAPKKRGCSGDTQSGTTFSPGRSGRCQSGLERGLWGALRDTFAPARVCPCSTLPHPASPRSPAMLASLSRARAAVAAVPCPWASRQLHAGVAAWSGDLSTRFAAAKEAITAVPSVGNMDKLQLYALFKQGTVGKNTTDAPGMLDFVVRQRQCRWRRKFRPSPAPARRPPHTRPAHRARPSGTHGASWAT